MPADMDRRRQMLRLGAAAALQTHCGLGAVAAWEVSGMMPLTVQFDLRLAAAGGIRDLVRLDVQKVYRRWIAERAAAEPVAYADFAEPGGQPTAFPERVV